MNDFLIFENISKSFGQLRALDRVTLGIARGEVFSLLGPSGCGKTTLLRLAAGFTSPDSRRILLDGRDITALPPEKRHAGRRDSDDGHRSVFNFRVIIKQLYLPAFLLKSLVETKRQS